MADTQSVPGLLVVPGQNGSHRKARVEVMSIMGDAARVMLRFWRGTPSETRHDIPFAVFTVAQQALRDALVPAELPIHCLLCAAERGVAIPAVCPHQIDFNVSETYIEWHVIDKATQRSIERCDEPDHALTHRAVAAGTADVVEATVQARIIRHRIVTEDTIGEDE